MDNLELALADVDFSNIYNKTEQYILKALNEQLASSTNYEFRFFDEKDIQDIYAFALNQLPSRYMHKSTIVINDYLSMEEVREALDYAMYTISKRPKI